MGSPWRGEEVQIMISASPPAAGLSRAAAPPATAVARKRGGVRCVPCLAGNGTLPGP